MDIVLKIFLHVIILCSKKDVKTYFNIINIVAYSVY